MGAGSSELTPGRVKSDRGVYLSRTVRLVPEGALLFTLDGRWGDFLYLTKRLQIKERAKQKNILKSALKRKKSPALTDL